MTDTNKVIEEWKRLHAEAQRQQRRMNELARADVRVTLLSDVVDDKSDNAQPEEEVGWFEPSKPAAPLNRRARRRAAKLARKSRR